MTGRWTAGTLCLAVLLLLPVVGGLGWVVYAAVQSQAAATEPLARVQVLVGDGTEARVWLERAGLPVREMPLQFSVPAGCVMLRVARHTPAGDWRQDEVQMELTAGRLHAVPIGEGPMRVVGKEYQYEQRKSDGDDRWGAGHYPVPGVVGWVTVDPQQTTVAAAPPPALVLGDATVPPADPIRVNLRLEPGEGPEDETTFHDAAGGTGWFPSRERLLVVLNPFPEEIRCTVAVTAVPSTQSWTLTTTLHAASARVFPLGAGTSVRVETRRASDGAWIGSSAVKAPPEADRPLLFTVGGAARYAWVGAAEGRMPAPPEGHWQQWLPHRPLRLRQAGDPEAWLLAGVDAERRTVGLVPVASAPLAALGTAPAVTPRVDVTVRAMEVPATKSANGVAAHPCAVSAVAAGAEGGLLGLMDGRVFDLLTGQALQASDTQRVVQMTATPYGLVLLTAAGQLATLKDRQLLLGASFGDPSLRLAPASSAAPSVRLYGGRLFEASFLLQKLAGGPAMGLSLPGADGSAPATVTAMAQAADGGALIAFGRRIERLPSGQGETQPVVLLPEKGPDVIGLLDMDGRLLFSTDDCVYELRGDLVLPLVMGIGGSLSAWRGGVVVCDHRSGRLFHLGGPALAGQAASSTGGQP